MLEEVLYVLEMLEGMHRVLLRMLKDVEGGRCLPEVLEVFDVPEVMRCVLFDMLKATEGRRCLPEVVEVTEVMRCVLEVLKVMRCVLVCMLDVLEEPEVMLCATLYLPQEIWSSGGTLWAW